MTHDAIVIGGGFAGATAARDLGEAGLSVLLLEARDRLGGRAYYRGFADTGKEVEFGGAWIEPDHQENVSREVERYGVSLAHSPDPQNFAFLVDGGRLTSGEPVPPEEEAERRRAIGHLSETSRRLDGRAPLARPAPELDVPLSEFMEPLALPAATRDYMDAWWVGEFGCEPSEVSALHALALVAGYGNDAREWFDSLALLTRFVDGTTGLVGAMVEDSGADVRLSAPVRAVEQDAGGVRVTTQGGEAFAAPAAVVAVPLNVLGAIGFAPALGEAKRAMAGEGHSGRAVKFWALVEGAPPHFYGFGKGPGGLVLLSTEYELHGASLMVGFGPEGLDADDPGEVQTAVEAFAPGARVLKVDFHDWNADPYAKGTWAAQRPGRTSRYGAALREPEGRLAFAGSDMAVGWNGWIEGAIESGGRAAGRTLALLAEEGPSAADGGRAGHGEEKA